MYHREADTTLAFSETDGNKKWAPEANWQFTPHDKSWKAFIWLQDLKGQNSLHIQTIQNFKGRK